MDIMRRDIGSLAALFAFEASGRLGNFTRAAAELGVTQAAISKQIQALEKDLGVALFFRGHRNVKLTGRGAALFEVVHEALHDIASAMAALRTQDSEGPVVIATTLAISHFWLLPRLPKFKQKHQNVPVRIISQDEPVDLRSGVADMAVRFGSGDWPDGNAKRLFSAEVYPLASPDFIAAHPAMESPADLRTLPLIAYDEVDPTWVGWRAWFANAGIDGRISSAMLQCTRYADAIQAAVMSQGIVLGWSGLNGGLEEHGALIRVSAHSVQVPGSFYLVTRPRSEEIADARAFADWVRDEAKLQIDKSRQEI